MEVAIAILTFFGLEVSDPKLLEVITNLIVTDGY